MPFHFAPQGGWALIDFSRFGDQLDNEGVYTVGMATCAALVITCGERAALCHLDAATRLDNTFGRVVEWVQHGTDNPDNVTTVAINLPEAAIAADAIGAGVNTFLDTFNDQNNRHFDLVSFTALLAQGDEAAGHERCAIFRGEHGPQMLNDEETGAQIEAHADHFDDAAEADGRFGVERDELFAGSFDSFVEAGGFIAYVADSQHEGYVKPTVSENEANHQSFDVPAMTDGHLEVEPVPLDEIGEAE